MAVCPSKKSQAIFPQLKISNGCPQFNMAPEGPKLNFYPEFLLLYIITMVPANVHFSKFLSSPHRPMYDVLPLPFALITDEGSCQGSNNPQPPALRQLMATFYAQRTYLYPQFSNSQHPGLHVPVSSDCKLKGGRASLSQEYI